MSDFNLDFGSRIKSERKRVHKSSIDFADYCGVGRNTQTNYEKSERKPDLEYLAKAHDLGCDVMYILTGNKSTDGSVVNETPYPYQLGACQSTEQKTYIEIPFLDIELSTSNDNEISSKVSNKGLPFKAHWLAERNLNPMFLSVVTARGDSMEPSINNNDAMLVDTRPIENLTDGIHVIRLEHGLLAKRLQIQINGGVEIISDNAVYRTQVVEKEKLAILQIVGKVVWVGKDL